jgi:hypothetical protein
LQAFAEIAGALIDRIALFVHDRWPLLLLLALLLGPRWKVPAALTRIGPAFERFSRKRLAACALVVGLSLALSLGAAALHGVPPPWLQDDFSYLLGAETLARGRVANQALPPQLATVQVLVTPHYVSKYPPGQAAMLALGLLLFGVALAGMWIAAAAACAAIWWALDAWLSPPLALAGGLLAALHPTMFEWSQSYRGGALTALGGALLFGAVGRLRSAERAGIGSGLAAGIGISLLAVTRPFEGLVFTVAVALIGAIDVLRRPAVWRGALVAAALPIALTLAALGAYDRAITGSALTMPYAIYEARYDPLSLFLWQPPRIITAWPNAEMATVYRSGVYGGVYARLSQPGGVVGELDRKVDVIRFALFGRPATKLLDALWPLLLAPLLALPSLLRRCGIARRVAAVLALFTMAPLILTGAVMTHYLAPAAGATAMLLLMLSMQLGGMFTHGRGAALAVAVAVLFLVNTATLWWSWVRSPDPGFEPRRRQIARAITSHGGKHLVLVAPDVLNAVYNGADVDASSIVWAHDLGDDRQLLARFPDRQRWQLVHRDGQVVAVRAP